MRQLNGAAVACITEQSQRLDRFCGAQKQNRLVFRRIKSITEPRKFKLQTQ